MESVPKVAGNWQCVHECLPEIALGINTFQAHTVWLLSESPEWWSITKRSKRETENPTKPSVEAEDTPCSPISSVIKHPHVWACSRLHCIRSRSLHYCTILPLPEADPVVAKGMRPRFLGYQTKSEGETRPDVRPQGQTSHVQEDNLISTLLMSIICQVSPNTTELHSFKYSLNAY